MVKTIMIGKTTTSFGTFAKCNQSESTVTINGIDQLYLNHSIQLIILKLNRKKHGDLKILWLLLGFST